MKFNAVLATTALTTLCLGSAAGSTAATNADIDQRVAATAQYVVVINIDGLNAGAIPALGPTGAPNLWRMRTEGAFTDNARTDYARTVTMPNHTTILTGRPVIAPHGHLWGNNNPDPLSLAPSLHVPHDFPNSPVKTTYEYVSSVFDVVHDHGMRTALYHQKRRMHLIEASYNEVNGAPDLIGADNGRNKIDMIEEKWLSALVDAWTVDMRSAPFQFTYLLFALTDTVGHHSTFDIRPGSEYMEAVKTSDAWVGKVLYLVEHDARFAGKTLVLMTSDHGGPLGGTDHGDVTNSDNYTVPIYAWGVGVKRGADLYALNPQYKNPGTSRPTNVAPDQPIRNGYVSNLALAALGLPPIPGAVLNADQSFSVGGPGGPLACGEPTITPASDAALFVWRNCDTNGAWHVRATAGGGYVNYAGSITANRNYSYVRPDQLEPTDVLNTSNPSAIGFDMKVANGWDDGFTFWIPIAATQCFGLAEPSNPRVLVGANRTAVTPPFNLTTLNTCTP